VCLCVLSICAVDERADSPCLGFVYATGNYGDFTAEHLFCMPLAQAREVPGNFYFILFYFFPWNLFRSLIFLCVCISMLLYINMYVYVYVYICVYMYIYRYIFYKCLYGYVGYSIKRITVEPGVHSVTVSTTAGTAAGAASGKGYGSFLDVFSSISTPPRAVLRYLPDPFAATG